MFDANKLDISDEFRRSIEAIHGYEDKVRIILNKADQVDHHELMRVYGALMWSIAKVINVPECPKVFVGSFWDQQLKVSTYHLFNILYLDSGPENLKKSRSKNS